MENSTTKTGSSPVAYLADIPASKSVIYPPHLRGHFEGRAKRRLGDAVGMKNFGVNLTTLEPGAWSAHRHWHTRQDEMIYLLEGELTLVTDGGRQVLKPGAVVGFPSQFRRGPQSDQHWNEHTPYIWRSVTACRATMFFIPMLT